MTLRTIDLLEIVQPWKSDYPELDELPHVHSWRPVSDEERKEAVGRRTVLPLFVLQDPSGQRSLHVQQDRLLLVWRFEAEGSPKEYVGYKVLRTELARRFDEFSAAVSSVAELTVIPERADATYQNLVDMPAREFAVGVLTGWATKKASYEVPSAYSGVRLSEMADDGEQRESLVAIEDGPDGLGTDFTIDVERLIDDGVGHLAALDDAHDRVLQLFQRFSGDELMTLWGRQ